MNTNFTTYLSSDHANFFDDSDAYWAVDDAVSVPSLFGASSWTNISTNNNTFLLNAPRIVSIPLPVVEDFIPLHTADVPFSYLPTPPPTPPSLTVYLLDPRTRSQQGRTSSGDGRPGKKARHSRSLKSRLRWSTTRPMAAGELLKAVRKKRVVRRTNHLQDIEHYLKNLELFDDGDVPLTNPD